MKLLLRLFGSLLVVTLIQLYGFGRDCHAEISYRERKDLTQHSRKNLNRRASESTRLRQLSQRNGHYALLAVRCPGLLPPSDITVTLRRLRRLLKKCDDQPRTDLPVATPSPTVTTAPVNNTPIPPVTTVTPAPQPSSTPTAPLPTPTRPTPTAPPVDALLLQQWESEMVSFGRTHCDKLKSSASSFDEKLAATYYDAIWVFLQIASYTKDSYWLSCADAAKITYRDAYVVPAQGIVPGYWNFTDGLTQLYLTRGDEASKSAALLLAQRAAFAADTTPLANTQDAELSREVAYTITAYLNAEKLGAPRRPRLTALVSQALDQMDQWFVRRSADYVRPFMVGLTAHALIKYYEEVPDPRIPPMLRLAAETMWSEMWLDEALAFKYTDRVVASGGTSAAPDLNMLVAPLYAWLFQTTGEPEFLKQTDALFNGSVQYSWLNNGKQFNQSYRWAFEVLTRRNRN